MIVGVIVSHCFLVPSHPGYPGLKGRKTVVVVVVRAKYVNLLVTILTDTETHTVNNCTQ